VVNTLHAELSSLGFNARRNKLIDLYLADGQGIITHVLEIKTDQCTTSIYQAVGQVMLHGVGSKSEAHRILVLPGKVSADTASRLKRLGISVLSYEWKGERPIFDGLAGLLKG
jgi:hypothetical protein